MLAPDGKMKSTDVADQEQLDEMIDPELSIDWAIDIYRRKGYSEEWINQRLQGDVFLLGTEEFGIMARRSRLRRCGGKCRVYRRIRGGCLWGCACRGHGRGGIVLFGR